MGLWRTCAMARIHSFCSFSCSHMKTNWRHGVSTVMPYVHLFLRAFLGSHSFTEYPLSTVPMKMTPNSSASYIQSYWKDEIEKPEVDKANQLKGNKIATHRRDSDTHTKAFDPPSPTDAWNIATSGSQSPKQTTVFWMLPYAVKEKTHIKWNITYRKIHNCIYFNYLFSYVKKNRNSE